MPAKKLQQFGGMLPAWDPKLLPDGQAAASTNGYLFSGALQGWRLPTLLRALTNPNAAFAYRIPLTTTSAAGVDTFNDAITAPSTWIESTDPDTNVVRSQVVNDTYQRYYQASPTQGSPTYNTLARIQAAQNFFELGINGPTVPPTIGVSGGGPSATLGPTTTNGSVVNVGGNLIYLLPIVPTGALLLNSVSFLANATTPNDFAAVVYADAAIGGNKATAPGALMGTGVIESGTTAAQLASSTFTNPIALTANTPYWIGLTLAATTVIQEGDTFNASVSFANTFANGPPTQAPAVTTGQPDLTMYASLTTSGVIEARTYVYTYVSAYGEESQPSPPTLLNGYSNGTWTITPALPPLNEYSQSGPATGISNVALIRIYRTVVSSAGAATYFFVADLSIGSTDPDAIVFVAGDVPACYPPQVTFIDNFPDSTVALNLQMPSLGYFPPPANMQGILVLPNGMYVGFINNQIWFSVPYLPHAWPPAYVYTVDFPVVGLGVTSGALVAVTASKAWIFTGTSPTALSQVECVLPDPPLSRGSIISTDAGVFYSAANGLIQIPSTPPASNVTELWITREKWVALTPQKYIRAIPFLGQYFAFGTVSPPSVSPQDTSVAQVGFNVELASDAASFTIWPQPGGHRIGFNQSTAPGGQNVVNVMNDPWTGFGMLIQNGGVWWYDFTNQAPVMQPYDWTSKIYQDSTKRSYSAMRVFFTVPPGTPPNNTAVLNTAPTDDPSWAALSASQWGIILVYADPADTAGDGAMQLVCAREIRKSGGLLRISSDFKAENWQFRFLGRVNISNLQVATSVAELANV